MEEQKIIKKIISLQLLDQETLRQEKEDDECEYWMCTKEVEEVGVRVFRLALGGYASAVT